MTRTRRPAGLSCVRCGRDSTVPFRSAGVGRALGCGVAEKARKIEGLGYSTFFMPDHFIDTRLAPMVGLAMAAEATTTLRVGALVFDNDYKHPAILAKETATIDVLSDGRTELGIGAGWMRVDYDALGLPYDSAGVRIARLEEALAGTDQGVLRRGIVQLLGHPLHDHRLRLDPEADPAAAPHHDRWWRARC